MTRGSQARTAAAPPLGVRLQAVVPGTVTTVPVGPGDGCRRVALPLYDEVGTSTASSSVDASSPWAPASGPERAGETPGSTPAAPVSAAVRQATRAPAERPPVISRSPLSSSAQPVDDGGPGSIELGCRSRGTLPATL